MPGGQLGFLAVSTILGSVLFGPLLFLAAPALGAHDVHYDPHRRTRAIRASIWCGVYVACAIDGMSPDQASPRIWPYLGAPLLAVIICALLPWLPTGLLG